jgi:hypothetical protein
VLALESIPYDSRVGGTEPAKYSVYFHCHSSTHSEHDVCFHFPGRQNRSAKIRYFNGPAVDRNVTRFEGLELEYIKGKLAAASLKKPGQPWQAIGAISRSIEEAILERVFQERMHRLAQCCVAIGGLVEGA